ncbi:MAG: PAS domain-containing sensor histidine kinase [Chloroflexota bacterium]
MKPGKAEQFQGVKHGRAMDILDAMNDGVYIVSEQRELQYLNSVMENEFGPVDGRKCYQYIHGREDPCPWCRNEEVIYEGKTVRSELYLERNGKTYEVIDTPFHNDDGTVSKLKVMRDITERKRLEDTLREHMARLQESEAAHERAEVALQYERDKLKNILDAMEDGVYIVNQQYDIEYVNPALEAQFGPVQGRKCYKYLHDRDTPCPWCKNQEVFAGKTVRWEWYSFKNGKTYDLVDTPLKNRDGSVSKLEIFRDITDRKRLEEKKDEFIGLVSHELRSPLTVIIGAISTVLSEGNRLSTDETRQLLQDAAWEAESLSHLVGNLLELSRAQADRLLLDARPTDMEKLVRETVRDFRYQSPEHQFVIDFPDGLPSVQADQLRMQRVIHNLLENAVKYSPDGGTIRIFGEAEPRAERLLIGVSDQGVGISIDDQEKLFEPFHRLGNPKLEGVEGAGLGLLTCRRLVEAHGGTIWVDSEPGRGSTFYFTLPLTHMS